jgi:hypothetical protein
MTEYSLIGLTLDQLQQLREVLENDTQTLQIQPK